MIVTPELHRLVFTKDEICRIFNVPPSIVKDPIEIDQIMFENPEAFGGIYTTDSEEPNS